MAGWRWSASSSARRRRTRTIPAASSSLLLAGIAALAAAMLLMPALASARTSSRTQLSLVSPRNYSFKRLETRTLVVRVKAVGPSFRATLNGRNVTGRFGRAVGGARTARFVRGRDFALGRGSFMAAVGPHGSRRTRTVGFSFTAWRRDPRPLVFHRRPRERAGGGEMSALTIDVVSDGHVTSKQIWVNGKRIRDHLLGPGDRSHPIAHGCGCHLDIGANHGLHFGPNRVTVELSHRGFRFQRTTRIFRIARTAPLAGAGQDRLVSRGNPAMLTGASSRPARRGDRLAYRWRIVHRPRRGHARLVGARRMRPRLIATRPGVYRVRLQVTEIGRGSRAATRSDRMSRAATSTPLTPVNTTSVDDVDVCVTPTDDPMGLPIHTITGSGAIQVGSTTYPMQAGAWMQILVLNQTCPKPAISDTFYTPQQLGQAKSMLDDLPAANHDLVIISVPRAENLVYPNRWHPNVKPNVDYKTLNAIVGAIGGVAATPDGWLRLSDAHFSIIGQKGTPAGQAWQSAGMHAPGPSQPTPNGSLDGYLQMVHGNAYSYVSPTYLPIDTEAPGSDGYTHNAIKVGSQTFNSATIAGGDTGAQLVVLDSTATHLLAQATYTLVTSGGAAVDGSAGNPAGGDYGTGVKGLAATMQYYDRNTLGPALVILQTFGQGQSRGDTPNGSPSWANDNVNAADLRSWDGRAFISPGDNNTPGADNTNEALYNVWNPGYPTVAGQVGSLTSGAGHDIVAGFGDGQNNNGTPNGGLTVVASTHPYDGRQNFVQGQTGHVKSNPRVVGTLTRTRQGQWTVQTASDSPAFAPSELWQTAFAAPEPWPYTSPSSEVSATEAQQYQAAEAYIAGRLWPGSGITDVRAQYLLKSSDDWEDNARITQAMTYPANDANPGFSPAQFSTMQTQLVTEMGYVDQIEHLVNQWKRIFTDNGFTGYVNLQQIANTVVDDATRNHDNALKKTTDLNWLEIGDYSLEVGSSIIGFTPLAEAAEPMGLLANVLGLASASMGSEPGSGESRFDSTAIWDRADQLGYDLVKRMQNNDAALNHLEDLFIGNWAKLRRAGQNASGAWAYGTAVQRTMKQALAVTTTQEFYKALLPLTYQQWVIDPNGTGAEDPMWGGGDGRALPGRGYRCWSDGDDAYPSPPKSHPFSISPDGGLSYAGIHGWNAPASTTWPAAGNQTWYELRVLKSIQDPMKVVTVSHRGDNPTIWHRGASPPASLVNGLFEPINAADDSGLPTQLGLNKTAFYGDYGNGWGWRKAVCS